MLRSSVPSPRARASMQLLIVLLSHWRSRYLVVSAFRSSAPPPHIYRSYRRFRFFAPAVEELVLALLKKEGIAGKQRASM